MIVDNQAKVSRKDNGVSITLSNGDEFVCLEYGQQGLYYKDTDAFNKKHGVAYINEYYFEDSEHSFTIKVGDDEFDNCYRMPSTFTYNDFIEIANGDKNLANFLFEVVDWQNPYSLLQEVEEYWGDENEQLFTQVNN
jgi:hypothetical protein